MTKGTLETELRTRADSARCAAVRALMASRWRLTRGWRRGDGRYYGPQTLATDVRRLALALLKKQSQTVKCAAG